MVIQVIWYYPFPKWIALDALLHHYSSDSDPYQFSKERTLLFTRFIHLFFKLVFTFGTINFAEIYQYLKQTACTFGKEKKTASFCFKTFDKILSTFTCNYYYMRSNELTCSVFRNTDGLFVKMQDKPCFFVHSALIAPPCTWLVSITCWSCGNQDSKKSPRNSLFPGAS